MSIGEQIRDSYNVVRKLFLKPKLIFPVGWAKYPKVTINDGILTPKFLNDLLQSCVNLYNQIDSVVEALKLTVPEVYEELKDLINTKIIGELSEKYKIVQFVPSESVHSSGEVIKKTPKELSSGIGSVIELLVKSVEYMEMGYEVASNEFYYTARLSFRALRAALTMFLTRFNYVMMFPHRIVLDRVILETGLKKHGMDRVVRYIQSAEEHFNEQKYVEFCAMSRNALHEAIKNACLIIDGVEHGFSANCTRLKEIDFLKSTILKQIKEFNGALSAGGSHPPSEEMSTDEAKFLLDSLYGILGLIVLRLSSWQK